MTNYNSIRANNPQHRPSSPQHNNSNAAQQQTAGTTSRTPQPPEEQVFQTPHILNRIIELSDSPKNTTKTLHPVNISFSLQDLLEAFSQDPQTRNNSILHNYLQNAPEDSPLPNIDITLSPEDLNNNDILSALRYLQSSNNTSPIKAVIVVDTSSKLQSLIDNQLTLLQENSSLFRAISIKEEVSIPQLQNEIAPLVPKLQYTTASQITPTIKHFSLRISLYTPTLNNFLTTDFSTLPENLQITQVEIDRDRKSSLKETLTNAENPQLQQQLNNLKHATTLKLKIEIAPDVTLTVPPSVTTLSTNGIYGTLQFAPGSQCSQLSINYIWRSGTVTIPPSVTTLTTNGIDGTLLFAPDSQCSSLSIGYIDHDATLNVPASVTSLTAGDILGTLEFAPSSQCTTLSVDLIKENATITVPKSVTKLTIVVISGTLNFEPGCQCSEISLGTIWPESTVTIPACVTTLTTDTIEGTLEFEPDSQCSSLHLGFIEPESTLTIPAAVTTLTIYDITYTGQKLHDLKSGKTSVKNLTFEQ